MKRFCLTCEKWFPEEQMFTEHFCSRECADWDREKFPELQKESVLKDIGKLIVSTILFLIGIKLLDKCVELCNTPSDLAVFIGLLGTIGVISGFGYVMYKFWRKT
jgi:hypothetical protein